MNHGGADRPARTSWPFYAGVLAACLLIVGQTWCYLQHSLNYGLDIWFLTNLADPALRRPLELIRSSSFYPFGYSLLLIGQHRLVNMDYAAHVLLGTTIYCLAALGTALAGRRMFSSDWSGGGAALLLACLPGVTVFSKFLEPEALLLALAPLALWAYLSSDRLVRPAYAAVLGLIMAAGFLTKWSLGAYIGPLFLWFALDWALALRREPELRLRRALGMLLALALFLGSTLPWYLLVFNHAEFSRTTGLDPYFLQYSYPANLRLLLSYFIEMIGRRSWALTVVLFGLGLALAAPVARRRAAGLALLGLAVPLAIFALPPHLDHRYLLPLLPQVALVLAGLLAAIQPVAARRGLAVLAATFFLCTNLVSFLSQSRTPPAFEVIMGPHFRGDLLWGRSQAEPTLELALGLARERFPDKTPLVVASQPFWTDFHIWQNYLHHLRAAEPERYAELELTWEYVGFHQSLRATDATRADVVLMDCGPADDCLARNREYVERFLALDAEDRYTLAFDNVERGYTLDDLRQDLEILHDDYDLVRRLEPDKGNTILMYLRREQAAETQEL